MLCVIYVYTMTDITIILTVFKGSGIIYHLERGGGGGGSGAGDFCCYTVAFT